MKQEPVKFEEGRAMAERIGSHAYLECSASAKTRDGVCEVFEAATLLELQRRKLYQLCVILYSLVAHSHRRASDCHRPSVSVALLEMS